jgi:Cu(I)/Ag(I) efflux system membrane fusion protein
MKTKNIILLIIIAALGAGTGLFVWQDDSAKQASAGKQAHHEIWYCPMHPQIIYDHPGHCPICGMDLVKKENSPQQQDPSPEGYTAITETPQRQQLIGVRTVLVGKKTVIKTIRAAGRVAYDPDLYKAELQYVEDYIAYLRLDRRLSQGSYTIQDAQRRLKEKELDLIHMGATEQTMAQLQADKFPDHSLLVPHRDGAQVFAEIFGEDLGFIDVGQKAVVEVPDYHQTFNGTVTSVDPIIDPISQTARVRIYINARNDLHSNLFVQIRFPVELNEAAVIPRSAVMDTGLRKIVFVSKEGDSFQPREIQTGLETDDGFEVKSGLKEGEHIVVSGNFLLDSESRVQASLQGGIHGQ